MWKIVTVLIMLQIAPVSHADNDGDVCSIRPDLCDDSIPEPAPRPAHVRQNLRRSGVNPSAVNRQQQHHRRTIEPQARPARTAPVAKAVSRANPIAYRQAKSGACREANKPYNLNDIDLPVCGARTASAADATADQAAQTSATRAPASVRSGSNVDFNSYLNANSSHPAMAHHEPRAQVFQESARQVTFNAPNVDTGVGVREQDPTPPPAPASNGGGR